MKIKYLAIAILAISVIGCVNSAVYLGNNSINVTNSYNGNNVLIALVDGVNGSHIVQSAVIPYGGTYTFNLNQSDNQLIWGSTTVRPISYDPYNTIYSSYSKYSIGGGLTNLKPTQVQPFG
ncbi:MAG: hypothetical protein LBT10_02465 [Methanobrevibacter sp.]|nr:hypothetical protein [Methanobrevibacter sp.]